MTIKGSDLAFVGGDGKWVLEKGDFRIAVGSEETIISATVSKKWETPNID